jgi:hypothetical protein
MIEFIKHLFDIHPARTRTMNWQFWNWRSPPVVKEVIKKRRKKRAIGFCFAATPSYKEGDMRCDFLFDLVELFMVRVVVALG